MTGQREVWSGGGGGVRGDRENSAWDTGEAELLPNSVQSPALCLLSPAKNTSPSCHWAAPFQVVESALRSYLYSDVPPADP